MNSFNFFRLKMISKYKLKSIFSRKYELRKRRKNICTYMVKKCSDLQIYEKIN